MDIGRFIADVGQSVANFWTNKIDYSIETPSKAAVFGTMVTVNFRLIPLLKGLRIEWVHTKVYETQELKISEGPDDPGRCKAPPRVVVEDKWHVSENAETQEVFDAEGFPNEGYIFARNLDLPKNLRQCMQSTDTSGFKIKHTLHFKVQMRNPDGHLSEVFAASIHLQPLLMYLR